jgi:hypothetical protein
LWHVSGDAAVEAAMAAAAQVVGEMGRSVGFKWMDGGDGVVSDHKGDCVRELGVGGPTGQWR